MEIRQVYTGSAPGAGIYSFPITLPNNPLKWLNCYVIKAPAGGRNLLIDTGFNISICKQELEAGIAALALRPEDTDVFLTHVHSDHVGNAHALEEKGYRLLMSRIDLDLLRRNNWDERYRQVLREGMPEEIGAAVFINNPAQNYASEPFQAREVEDGQVLRYGEHTLRCVLTPGHSPGHMCLYDQQRQILFTGDHVLFDITPNITSQGLGSDSLGCYLDSLRAVRKLAVALPLPAHRNVGELSFYERIDALLLHHERRLAEAERIVLENPGIDAYTVAGQMQWRIRARNWAEFPPGQKWFAMGEALAHLDYLVLRGKVLRQELPDDSIRYTHI